MNRMMFFVCLTVVLMVNSERSHAGDEEAIPISSGACLSDSEIEDVRVRVERGDLLAIRRLAHHYGACADAYDEKKQLALYRQAAQYGFAQDIWNLAAMIEAMGDNKTAFPLFLKAAKQGDQEAMRRVAAAYLEGKGVAEDRYEAALWLEAAASRGSATSAVDLAKLLRSFGKRETNIKALAWLMAAKTLTERSLGKQADALSSELRSVLNAADVAIAAELADELAGKMR